MRSTNLLGVLKMIAQIEVKEVYGNRTIYPVNDQAKLLAQIAGTKTLTVATLNLAKKLGFTFEVVQPTITI
jgi:hypothetical protein